MNIISRIALILVIIGGLNWGLIGFFQFDLVAGLLGGQDSIWSRAVYALVGISAIISIGLLFIKDADHVRQTERPKRMSQPHFNTEFGEETEFKNKDHKK